jgi:sulfatase modifying factor 1
MRSTAQWIFAVALACAACHGDQVGDFQGQDSSAQDSVGDSGSDSSVSSDADALGETTGIDSTPLDVHHDTVPLDVGPLDGGVTCPDWATNGPQMIQLHPKFCIDDLEVDREDFNAFLGDPTRDGGGPPPPSPKCDGNVLPPMFTADPNHPANVDWCDAWMFCAWAGKRLCGKIDGGGWSTSSTDWVDPALDQWSFACRGGSPGTNFPYGADYVAGECNDTGALMDDKTHLECAGPPTPAHFDFVWDMSGNVAEWVDACDDTAPFHCQIRGGYYASTAPDGYACDANNSVEVTTNADWVGFRCCYP